SNNHVKMDFYINCKPFFVVYRLTFYIRCCTPLICKSSSGCGNSRLGHLGVYSKAPSGKNIRRSEHSRSRKGGGRDDGLAAALGIGSIVYRRYCGHLYPYGYWCLAVSGQKGGASRIRGMDSFFPGSETND